MKSEDISKIADGDEMVFTRFMEHYSTRLYYYAYGLLGQKEMAEEVVSDVFFEVWKNRKGLVQIEYMNAWLQDNTPVKVGLMGACPDGEGFNVKFEHFKVTHLPDQRRMEWLKKNAE